MFKTPSIMELLPRVINLARVNGSSKTNQTVKHMIFGLIWFDLLVTLYGHHGSTNGKSNQFKSVVVLKRGLIESKCKNSILITLSTIKSAFFVFMCMMYYFFFRIISLKHDLLRKVTVDFIENLKLFYSFIEFTVKKLQ